MNTTAEDLRYLRERKAAALEKRYLRVMTREQVEAQTQAFLAKGGKITSVPIDFVPSLRGKRW